MILVTGGLGFIGSHTGRALLDLGESCVLSWHRADRVPDFLAGDVGDRLAIERLDLGDPAALADLGRRYPITGIVHLGGVGLGRLDPIEELGTNLRYLLNVLRAAGDWQVRRLSVASTIGVYIGVPEQPFREDAALPMVGVQPVEAAKKCAEILAGLIGGQAGFEAVSLRIGAIFGPLGRPDSRFIAVPRMVHAAAAGAVPQGTAYAEDGMDLCYVKDCARAIALVQTAAAVRHRTYNIGTGRPTRNREVAAAIRAVVPDADLPLAEGADPHRPGGAPYLDTARLHDDTGFRPRYDIAAAVADYLDWLRAGHPR